MRYFMALTFLALEALIIYHIHFQNQVMFLPRNHSSALSVWEIYKILEEQLKTPPWDWRMRN